MQKNNHCTQKDSYWIQLFNTSKNKIISLIQHISLVEVLLAALLFYVYLIGIIHVTPDGINKVFAIKLKKAILYIPLLIIFLIGISSLVFENIKSYRLRSLEMSKKVIFC